MSCRSPVRSIVFEVPENRRSGGDRRGTPRPGQDRRRWILAVGAVILALSGANMSRAATQGTAGATSSGSLTIGLVKLASGVVQTPILSLKPKISSDPSSSSAVKMVALCASADGLGAIQVQVIGERQSSPLARVAKPQGISGCDGDSLEFAVPEISSALHQPSRTVTFMAGPV